MNTNQPDKNGAILITGASKRLGRAMALAAAERGLDVAVHYRSSEHDAMNVVDQIKAMGRKAISVKAELTDDSQAREMFDRIEAKLGSVRYVINNASVFAASSASIAACMYVDERSRKV